MQSWTQKIQKAFHKNQKKKDKTNYNCMAVEVNEKPKEFILHTRSPIKMIISPNKMHYN